VARRPLAPAPPADVVAERLAQLRARLESAGRDPSEVLILAVTKGFDTSAVESAFAAGLHEIGENYPDELLSKATAESPPVIWHMIGTIQRRVVKSLAPVVGCWQTVTRHEEVASLARYSPGTQVFIQVDTTGLANRNGCSPSEAPALVASAREAGLVTRGLMTIGPQGPPESARAGFDLVAFLARDLGLSEVSMGMSDDLEVAAAAGTTMLRVGRGLFGPRPGA
jgi:uncharacterized pyridoxal phosphate-containing UPF0001 family protein